MRKLKLLVVANIVVLLSLFIILLSSFIGYCITKKSRKAVESVKTYQYIIVDTLKNDTSRGFVSFPSHIKVDKFFNNNNDNDEGVMSLILEPGENEYECTGSCFCKSSEWRRTTSSSFISKSFTILIGAATSLLAYNQATSYFHNMCRRRGFRDLGCSDEDDIESEVEEPCIDLSMFEEKIAKRLNESLTRKREYRKYFCEGHCLTRRLFLNIVNNPAEKVAAEFGCENHRLHQEVNVEVMIEDEETLYDQAFNWFIYHNLEPMCRGLGHYTHHNDPMYGLEKETYCMGSDLFENQSVICRKDGEEFDYSRLEKKKKKKNRQKKKKKKKKKLED